MGGPTSVGSISRYLEDPISRSLRMRSIDRSRANPSLNVNYRALFLFIDCYAVVSFKLAAFRDFEKKKWRNNE